MISHREFERLRLSEFVDDVLELSNWRFMDRIWVGEATGFTEWLRLEDNPGCLGSVSLDLLDLSDDTSQSILTRLGLSLRCRMRLSEIRSVLGPPVRSQSFVADRASYDFEIGESNRRYSISCTIHKEYGLNYLVLAPILEPDDV